MTKPPYIPSAGDIIWLVLDPRVGHEQSGRRPAIVLSPKLFTERTGLAIIAPITSNAKELPFEIALTKTKTTGVILPIHVRSVDVTSRKAKLIEKVPKSMLTKVRRYIALMIEVE